MICENCNAEVKRDGEHRRYQGEHSFGTGPFVCKPYDWRTRALTAESQLTAARNAERLARESLQVAIGERDEARRELNCGNDEPTECALDDNVCLRHYIAQRSEDAHDIEMALGVTAEDDLCGWHQIAPFAEKVRGERDHAWLAIESYKHTVDSLTCDLAEVKGAYESVDQDLNRLGHEMDAYRRRAERAEKIVQEFEDNGVSGERYTEIHEELAASEAAREKAERERDEALDRLRQYQRLDHALASGIGGSVLAELDAANQARLTAETQAAAHREAREKTEADAAAMRVAAVGVVDQIHAMNLAINPTSSLEGARAARAAYDALAIAVRFPGGSALLARHRQELEAKDARIAEMEKHLEVARAMPWTNCPDCGRNVAVDEDGCCSMCGADALHYGVDGILDELRAVKGEVERKAKALEDADRLIAAIRVRCRREIEQWDALTPLLKKHDARISLPAAAPTKASDE